MQFPYFCDFVCLNLSFFVIYEYVVTNELFPSTPGLCHLWICCHKWIVSFYSWSLSFMNMLSQMNCFLLLLVFVIYEYVVTNELFPSTPGLCHLWICCHKWTVSFYSWSLLVCRLYYFILQCLVFYVVVHASTFAIATAFLHYFCVALYTSLSSSSLDSCHFFKCICYVHHQGSFSWYRLPGFDSPNLDLSICKSINNWSFVSTAICDQMLVLLIVECVAKSNVKHLGIL